MNSQAISRSDALQCFRGVRTLRPTKVRTLRAIRLAFNASTVLTILTILLLAGCGDNSQTSSTSTTNSVSSGSPVTAPVDYLKAVAKGQQDAEKTLDTTAVNKAIQMFGVDHGRNPKDLNELVQQKYILKIPDPPYGTKLVYDANSGTVTVQKQ